MVGFSPQVGRTKEKARRNSLLRRALCKLGTRLVQHSENRASSWHARTCVKSPSRRPLGQMAPKCAMFSPLSPHTSGPRDELANLWDAVRGVRGLKRPNFSPKWRQSAGEERETADTFHPSPGKEVPHVAAEAAPEDCRPFHQTASFQPGRYAWFALLGPYYVGKGWCAGSPCR
jgi:hypothetical protein